MSVAAEALESAIWEVEHGLGGTDGVGEALTELARENNPFEGNLPLHALKARVIEELRAAEGTIPFTHDGVLTDAGILYLVNRMLDAADPYDAPRDFMRKSWREGLVSA